MTLTDHTDKNLERVARKYCLGLGLDPDEQTPEPGKPSSAYMARWEHALKDIARGIALKLAVDEILSWPIPPKP